jgi:hypothetical protein
MDVLLSLTITDLRVRYGRGGWQLIKWIATLLPRRCLSVLIALVHGGQHDERRRRAALIRVTVGTSRSVTGAIICFLHRKSIREVR